MLEKYSNFVIQKPTKMGNSEKIVVDYQTFLESDSLETDSSETPTTEETPIKTEKDPKDIKLFYTLETTRIEVSSGTDIMSRGGDKTTTFDKIIKRITRISKFIKIPIPVLTLIETKRYYSLVFFGQNGFSYYHGKFTNGKNFTDNFSEIEKIRNTLTDQKWQITSKDVKVYDLTMATVIKPEDEWIILGIIDYKDGLLKAAPGQQVPIELVGDMSGNSDCDHCHKRIYRNKIVFVKKIKDGTILRVGGTCIKNYLGYDYEKVLAYLTDISFLGESWGDSSGGGDDWGDSGGYSGGRHIETEISVNEIVKYYIWWYNNRGYISRASAEKINSKKREEWLKNNPTSDPEDYYYSDRSSNKQSTGDSVKGDVDEAYSPPENTGKYQQENMDKWLEFMEEYESRLKTISDDNPHIQKFYDFIEENKENNFLFNVNNMIKQNSVKKSLINYIAGGCSFYFGKLYSEEMKRKAEEEKLSGVKVEVKPSEWVGVVGEKTKLENLEIVHIGGFETQWGWSNVYKLKDPAGNVYTKFGTIGTQYTVKKTENDPNDNNIQVGDIISVTAQIKKHDEYKDIKQTTLGRVSKF